MEGFLYILKSLKTGKYYIGSSINPEKRLVELHNKKKVKATKYQTLYVLLFKQKYPTVRESRIIERKLKMMKSKTIIDKIIKDDFCKLSVGLPASQQIGKRMQAS